MREWRRFKTNRASSACAVALVTILAAAGCDEAAEPSAAAAAPAETAAAAAATPDSVLLSPEERQAGGITVALPRREARAGTFSASAILQTDATRTARVGSFVDGVVLNAPVQVGARIAAGARLASIHSHAVHDARADYRRAVAERRQAETALAFLSDAEARTSRLLAARAASQQEAERARTDRVFGRGAVAIAESEVRRALDALDHLGIEQSEATRTEGADAVPVIATLGGVVLERLVTEGTAVTTGTPLFVISDLTRLWAIAEIDEAHLPAVAAGQAAELTVAAYPERSFPGRIIATGESVSPDTRRVTVRIEVANPGGALKPQMFATVRLPAGTPLDVLLVPRDAVQTLEQKPVVFVEDRAGRFARRHVTTGVEHAGLIEIQQGLAAGDRVATTGSFLIKSKLLQAGLPE